MTKNNNEPTEARTLTYDTEATLQHTAVAVRVTEAEELLRHDSTRQRHHSACMAEMLRSNKGTLHARTENVHADVQVQSAFPLLDRRTLNIMTHVVAALIRVHTKDVLPALLRD